MSIPGRIIKRIRTDGFTEAFHRSLYSLSWRYEQWRIGMSPEITKDIGLGDNDGDCQGYEPIDFKCFKFIMEHMDIIPGQEVLLDYGCGKGRAIILAATYPFKKIIGDSLVITGKVCCGLNGGNNTVLYFQKNIRAHISTTAVNKPARQNKSCLAHGIRFPLRAVVFLLRLHQRFL